MIAEVYPIMKLPRRCTFFDYAVPNDLHTQVGDLVRMPFKNRSVYGIVAGLKTTSEAKKLASLEQVVLNKFLDLHDLVRFTQIANRVVQSVSSVLYTALPHLPVNGRPTYSQASEAVSIRNHDVQQLEDCLRQIEAHTGLAIAGDLDMGFALAFGLRRKMSGQILLLVPRERDALLLAQYLNLGERTGLLHGHTHATEKAKLAEAWRLGDLHTLIGTRAASLLPAKALTAVFILEAGNTEHVNARRNPHFDAREAAKLLATQHQAKYLTFDALPRLEDALNLPLIKTVNVLPAYQLVNLGSAEEISAEPLLSHTLLLAIEKALQLGKKTLLFLNRKGIAKRLQCGKCGHIPTCGTCGHIPTVRKEDLVCANCQTEMWLPHQCPACGSRHIKLRGIGGAKIKESLQTLFPKASLGSIEKGQLIQPEADIVVATEYYFTSVRKPFHNQRLGVIADLAADITLHASDFRGSEETARKLHRLFAFASRQAAEVYIQTWVPEILQAMVDLPTFIQAELDLRQRYHLPPSTSRLLLENTTLEALPDNLADTARDRGDVLELTVAHNHDLTALKALPDSVKISLDGPYA